MGDVTIRPAVPEDCVALAPRLRQADIDEMNAMKHRDAEEALRTSLQLSALVWAAEYKGQVCVLFGVGTHPGDLSVGVPWLLASQEIDQFPMSFLRGSRRYIDEMQNRYEVLTNYVDIRHTAARKWIEWCGFEPYRAYEALGEEQRPFLQYIRY